MKKNLIIVLVSLFSISALFSMEGVRTIKAEVARIKKQTNEMVPADVKKLNTFEKVVKTFDENLFCLLTGKKCSPRERLLINYTLGFIIGSSMNIGIMPALLGRYNVTNPLALAGSQVTQEILFEVAKLRGALVTPYLSALREILTSAAFVTLEIADVVEKTVKSESILAFLKELSSWIAMNVKCVWSESHCSSFTNELQLLTPAAKREGLYFWMGYISGVMVKHGLVQLLQAKIAPYTARYIDKFKEMRLFPGLRKKTSSEYIETTSDF